MPYIREGKCVYKKNPDGSKGKSMGCSETEEKAEAHMRALYANTKDSAVQHFSMAIVKASFETNEPNPNRRMRFRLSSSDTGKDLAEEAMSMELFKSFIDRIKNNVPVPEQFKSIICEETWCGGKPYLSIAHYKSGTSGKNLPGDLEEVYVDGDILKSKGYFYNTPLGRAAFDSLLDDMAKRKSGVDDFDPVRVSIGFLDLKHKHIPHEGGQEFIFERSDLGQRCALCEQGIGGKIYLDGILVHEALTRVPMNPRTETSLELEEKSMDDIKTRKDDARSIVKDLADTLDMDLEEKSVLVVKSDGTTENHPQPTPYADCYDPNTDSFNQDCIDGALKNTMADIRNSMHTVKSDVPEDVVLDSVMRVYNLHRETPVVEAKVEKEVVAEKAMDEKEKEKMHEEMEDKKEEKKEEKSALDLAFEALKSTLGAGKVADVQTAFNALAGEIEKSYTPADTAPNTGDLAEIVRSAIESAVAPLRNDIAMLKAQKSDTVSKSGVVPTPRSLRLEPQALIQKTKPVTKQRSQIELLARKSVYTGGLHDPEEAQQ